ncbi:ribosome biogenesis GTP-binding protein YihA/YsxC [Buchnera aphidicola]|uniref:Probable GTP-binding protein EngB n=1 Tax=Buchnera aphidicola subsp. Rhopalosiphum maidis TaxID=118109 RepID=A0A3G2I5K7_BUCRM|nr:ribosome biogenesis GTP-binding protein YihA/YsxC [Buchnera aphidicola]AYN24647.1 YihA family ribosome biogenesis GTP-binding protein [Buchnera aphidicola (Rhopalosiphum maidis)]
MTILNYNKTFFLKSISNISDIKIENGIEIAFVGYSNSGKSSAINALTNQKKLARFSKIPGRTQLINFFQVTSNFRIVDLPGYGYSKAPVLIKIKWQNMIHSYLTTSKALKGLVLLMDIRYPLKIFDEDIIRMSFDYKIPILLLLTKCDKFTINNQKIQFQKVHKKLEKFSNEFHIQLFSSLKKVGIKELKSKLNFWYKKYH